MENSALGCNWGLLQLQKWLDLTPVNLHELQNAKSCQISMFKCKTLTIFSTKHNQFSNTHFSITAWFHVANAM